MRYPNVFSPFKFGNVEIKNRIEIAPAIPSLSTSDGLVTRELIEYYKSLAKGGAGIVTIGDSAIDFEFARDHPFQLNIGDEKVIAGLFTLVEAIQRFGAKASIELNHPGRNAEPRFNGGRMPLAPSPPPPGETGPLVEMMPGGIWSTVVTEMTQELIDTVVNRYAEACYRCWQAGFEMVMIHGAHGQLIGQFTSPYTNKRTDRYGGNLRKRATFAVEVLEAIRRRVGDNLAIEYRISAEEIISGGMQVEETIEFIKMIQDKIDLLHVSRGHLTSILSNQCMIQPTYFPHGLNVPYAERIKKAVKVPVVAVGSIDMEMADRIIGEGKCDIVAVARANIADSDYVNKNRDGKVDEVRTCVRCNNCCTAPQGLPVRCAVNPVAGREVEFAEIRPADEKKKVVVVGGGPAGMEAAVIAASRGHRVTLYEKCEKLGGALSLAAAFPFKADMKKYLDWIIRQTHKTAGVEIKLSSEATAEKINAEKPDVLVLAVGAEPIIPDIPGAKNANVYWVGDIDKGTVPAGKNIVVVGAGLTGCEAALFLAQQGKKVTIIDMVNQLEIAQDANFINRLGLIQLLFENGVQFKTEVKLEEITECGAMVVDELGSRLEIPADTLILSLGFRARTAAVESLRHLAPDVRMIRGLR